MDTRGVEVSDELNERSLNEWIEIASDTLNDRGFEYGDPRDNLLRIYKVARALGVQLRNPSELALVFIATKLSRMVESPGREDSYLDLIGYAAILARTRFTDWSEFGTLEEY
jgi:hypothetical protein